MAKAKVGHLGIIPDGARRWAKQNNTSYDESYRVSMTKLVDIMAAAFSCDVETQTVYMLSKENLARPLADLHAVVDAETHLIGELLPEFCERWECTVRHAGVRELLPSSFLEALDALVADAGKNAGQKTRKLYLLVAYNPWDELHHAMKTAPEPGEVGNHLWVQESVDLIIRTGYGELLSNFLPLQSGYAELCFLPKYFNDIEIDDVVRAIKAFPAAGQRLMGR